MTIEPGGRAARALRVLAALAALFLGISAVLYVDFVRSNPPSVNVRWVPGLAPEQRLALEHRFSLDLGEFRDGTTWAYAIRDVSKENLRALVTEPAVDDTHKIDRTHFQLIEPVSIPLDEIAARTLIIIVAMGAVGVGMWAVGIGLRALTGAARTIAPHVARLPSAADRGVRRGLAYLFGSARAAAGYSLQALEFAGDNRISILTSTVWLIAFFFYFNDPQFPNDHFGHLAQAFQVTLGELPVRDFLDLGAPLQLLLSAFAQHFWGYSLLSEWLLISAVMATGFAFVFLASYDLSKSVFLSLFGTMVALSLQPRGYGYPKVLVYAAAALVMSRYLVRAGRRSRLMLAAAIALAFLFRHDHGVYVALSIASGLVAANWERGAVATVRAVGSVALAALVMVSPYLLYVQWNLGLDTYIRTAVSFTQRETSKASIRPPNLHLDLSVPFVIVEPAPLRTVELTWARDAHRFERLRIEQVLGLQAVRREAPRARTYELPPGSGVSVEDLAELPEIESAQLGDPNEDGADRLIAALRRVRLFPGILTAENALAWFYLIVLLVPWAALVSVAWIAIRQRKRRSANPDLPVALAMSVLCLLATVGLLRDAVFHRVADVGAPTAVLAVWLASRFLVPGAPAVPHDNHGPDSLRFARSGRFLAIAIVFAVTVGFQIHMLDRLYRLGLLAGPAALTEMAKARIRGLSIPVLDYGARRGAGGLAELTRYVHDCTAPTDRWWISWFEPQVYYYSGRGFASGQFHLSVRYFVPAFASSDMRVRIMRKFASESVPVVALDVNRLVEGYSFFYDRIFAEYRHARDIYVEGQGPLGVFLRKDWHPSGNYEPLGLPCRLGEDGLDEK